jgi:hypothetical protein
MKYHRKQWLDLLGHVTNKQIDRYLMQCSESGITPESIAKSIKCNVKTIENHFRVLGLPVERKYSWGGYRKGSGRSPQNTYTDEQVIKLRMNGLTHREIAKEVGICQDLVLKVLKRNGLSQSRPKSEIQRRKDQVRRLYCSKNNYSWAQIAQEVGISQTMVGNILNDLHIQRRKIKRSL